MPAADAKPVELHGFMFGVLGVIVFGLTLPMTRLAVAELDPIFVGLGRSLVAGVLAAGALTLTRQPWPVRRDLPLLAITAAGVIFGFPAFSALALVHAPAGHGGIILAILPLATAIAGVALARERPSIGFWLCGLTGSLAVLLFAWLDGAFAETALGAADLLFLAAIASAAIGYTSGAMLAQRLGGWQTISWTLLVAAPVLVVVVPLLAGPVAWSASPRAWAGFAYVALMSQFVGFFFWYKGLALGGVAKVGQAQLLQTFVTLAGAWVLLGETIGALEIGFALVVVIIVAIGRRMRVAR
ncbi:MAG: DMT family transporter [Hyphomicrobiaceae bacterium]